MASMRTTVTLDAEIARRARELGVNISAAARQGIADAVRLAMIESDRRAYVTRPEQSDAFWVEAEGWGAP